MKEAAILFFVYNFVRNQWILMLFSLIDLEMNARCKGMNLIYLAQFTLLHYLVIVETLKK